MLQGCGVSLSGVVIEARALLFDMDGVLVSSIASARRCWREWGRLFDVPGWETLEIPHGVRARDIVIHFRPEMDADAGLKVIEDMEVADTHDIVLLPGARALLQRLPADRWTIVTSAGKRLLVARLKAAGLPVPEELISAESVAMGKPHPEPYIKGAAMLGFVTAECVVVEDAPSGVKAGKAAGARVLAVTGTVSADSLKAAGADWVVGSLEDVAVIDVEGGLVLRVDAV